MSDSPITAEQKLIQDIRRQITQDIEGSADVSDDEVMELVANAVFCKTQEQYLSISEKRQLAESVFNSERKNIIRNQIFKYVAIV